MPIFPVVLNTALILVRLIVAAQAFRVAKEKEMSNFNWLAVHLIFFSLADVINTLYFTLHLGAPALTAVGPLFTRKLVVSLGDVALTVFVVQTFFRDRKSAYAIFMGLSILWSIAGLIIVLFPAHFYLPSNVLTFLWLVGIAFQTYRQVSGDPSVEDWVKARYPLIATYALLLIAPMVDNYISIITTGKLAPISMIATICLIAAVVLQYLVWMMPEGFRAFLNRKYQEPKQANVNATLLSEEEIMRQFQGTGV